MKKAPSKIGTLFIALTLTVLPLGVVIPILVGAGEESLKAKPVDPDNNARERSATVNVEVRGVRLVDLAEVQARAKKGQGHLHYRLDGGPMIATTATKLSFHELSPGEHTLVPGNGVAPGPIWAALIPGSFPPDTVQKFVADEPMKQGGQVDRRKALSRPLDAGRRGRNFFEEADMQACWRSIVVVPIFGLVLAGCAIGTAEGPPAPPQAQRPAEGPRTVQVDAAQAQRLQRIMTPLIQHMHQPIPLNQVRVGVLADPHINAANAGGGEFYVTTGLLQRANDDQLRAVLAHEIAHADLGHVAQIQTLDTGLNLGMILLDQLFPGSRVLTPIAAQLVTNAYTRKDEYAADAHGVEILRRAGYDGKTLMANALAWLQQAEGDSGGGFFATHPGTGDRIVAVRRLP